MRKNQVSINIQRFGDQVPENYPKNIQEIKVYADSNNLYEALTIAISQVLEEIKKHEKVPSGRVESLTNENRDITFERK